jgi:hypothetical protein
MYIVINPDRVLVTHSDSVDAQVIRRTVGEPGFDMFPLDRPRTMYAFVNDEGLSDQRLYPRNVTGGAVCAELNGRGQILAGRIVITGWNSYADGSEICNLDVDQAVAIEVLHANVLRALDGYPSQWAARVRNYADWVRTADTPQMTFAALEV